MEKRISETRSRIGVLENTLRSSSTQLDSDGARRKTIERELVALESKMEDMQGQGSICVVCG